jgi:hypothetical protein
MAKKRNIKVNVSKKRVRFISLDYYRYIVTGKPTDIQGIKSYHCDDNIIDVEYENGFKYRYYINSGEHQLKSVIKIINKYLGGDSDGTQQQFA